ncbi:hypothetical protein Q1695_010639 [Nippostrongylus brasiliensis]|nr:hypothetical protein Q1695_010639 [Nippostrongylus brasiliensis]
MEALRTLQTKEGDPTVRITGAAPPECLMKVGDLRDLVFDSQVKLMETTQVVQTKKEDPTDQAMEAQLEGLVIAGDLRDLVDNFLVRIIESPRTLQSNEGDPTVRITGAAPPERLMKVGDLRDLVFDSQVKLMETTQVVQTKVRPIIQVETTEHISKASVFNRYHNKY